MIYLVLFFAIYILFVSVKSDFFVNSIFLINKMTTFLIKKKMTHQVFCLVYLILMLFSLLCVIVRGFLDF